MPKGVFEAKGDPARSQIIDLLVNKTMPVNSIAKRFDISRPAIPNQIKVLNRM